MGCREEGRAVAEQAVQMVLVLFSPAVSDLVQNMPKFQDPCPSSSASPDFWG